MENRPKLKSRVNLQLLEESLTAFFCSARCPGDLILETYDLARSMRNSAGSKRRWRKNACACCPGATRPVVICLARSIENMPIPRDWQPSLEEERLLILSRFLRHRRRRTAEPAEQRNDLVANLVNQVFMAHAALGGRTEAFARKLVAADKPLLTLNSMANKNLVDMGSRGVSTQHDVCPLTRCIRYR